MTASVPPVHFANAAGTRLAYQDFGTGDETIVLLVVALVRAVERSRARAAHADWVTACEELGVEPPVLSALE